MKGVKFTSDVPADMQNMFELAVTRSRFALHRAGLNLTVGFTEDPPGNNDLFNYDVRLSAVDRQSFMTLRRAESTEDFDEAVLHTLGHIFFGVHMDAENNYMAQGEISSWFVRSSLGFGGRGSASDWNAEDWLLSTKEAIAEFFKDVYLKPRVSDNRTLWTMENTPTSFGAFVTLVDSVLCPAIPT